MAGRKFLQTKLQFYGDMSPRSSFVRGILPMTYWLQGKGDPDNNISYSPSVFVFMFVSKKMSKDTLS
jgi:hypothetical protein